MTLHFQAQRQCHSDLPTELEVKQQLQRGAGEPTAEPESQNATQFVSEEWHKQP